MADGYLNFDTKISTKGIKKGLNEIKSSFASLQKSTKDIGFALSHPIKSIELKKTAKDINSMKAEIDKLSNAKINTGEFLRLAQDVEKARQALFKLYDKQDKFSALGQKENSKQFQGLLYDIDNAENKLKELESEFEKFLKSDVKAEDIVSFDPNELKKLANPELMIGKDDAAIAKLKADLDNLRAKYEALKSSAGSSGGSSSGSSGGSSSSSGSAKKSTGLLSKLKSGFANLGKSAKSAFTATDGGLKSSLKKIMAYGFGIRSLFKLFNKLRGYAVDAFRNMAAGVPEVNKQLSAMKNSFTQAKNSIATAFQPLLSIVTPVVTQIMELFTRAANTVGTFFATLTGQKYIYKAAKANESFAESQESVAKSTKDANKQLASYDELQVIAKDNAESTDGGSNGNTSGGFEMETIDPTSQVSDFANKIKEAWAKADFTEIGTILRDKLIDSLNRIDWSAIDEKGLQISSSIATLINGLFAPVQIGDKTVYALGESIGNSIAEAFNVATHFLDNFVWKLDTKSIGGNFAAALQKVFTGYDWGSLGSTLSGIIVKGIDLITGFLEGVDWRSLPSQLKTNLINFIRGVKWNEVADSIFEGIGAAVGAVAGLATGVVETIVDSIKNAFKKFKDWKETLKEQGKSIWEGLWEGIKQLASDGYKWVKTHIFDPIWNGIKKAFGINSPSKKMAEIGGYLIDGLKNGIGDVWKKIKSKFSEFWTNLSAYLGNIKNNVKTKAASIVTSLKSGLGDIWKKIKEKFTNMWKSMSSWFSEKVKPKINIKIPTWDELKGKLKEIVNKAIDFINKNIIGKINNFLSFTVPDNKATQLIGIAGKSYKLGSIPTIPKLATGAYIPANYGEFLSILGDNKRQAEIVSPVPEMKKALAEVIQDFSKNATNNQPIYLYIDKKPVVSLIWDEIEKRYKQSGKAYAFPV